MTNFFSLTVTERQTDMSTNQTPVKRGITPGKLLVQGGTVVALVLLIVIFFAVRPDVFLSFTNVRNILYQVAILAIIAAAQTVTMVVGDFDLSVGATSSLAGAVAGAQMIAGTPMWIAILIALGVGLVVGVINGAL